VAVFADGRADGEEAGVGLDHADTGGDGVQADSAIQVAAIVMGAVVLRSLCSITGTTGRICGPSMRGIERSCDGDGTWQIWCTSG
jgi:hypothetical protein